MQGFRRAACFIAAARIEGPPPEWLWCTGRRDFRMIGCNAVGVLVNP
jgi:hypothetical protein